MDSPAVRAAFCWLWLMLLLAAAAGFARAGEARTGIGLQVVPVADGRLVVLQVVPHSPAARAGLEAGDLLVRIGDRTLQGTDLAKLSRETLWGAPGTRITLDYLRPGVVGMQEVTLLREPLEQVPKAPPGVKLLKPDTAQNGEEQ